MFKTDKGDISYSLGFISGDNSSGLYATFAEGHGTRGDRKITKPPEGQRPGWIYKIDGDDNWTFTSVYDMRHQIMFRASKEGMLPGATAFDLVALMTDADGVHMGVCEIGGPAA